jgi:thiol-disulfide isomerase/thioredoxin
MRRLLAAVLYAALALSANAAVADSAAGPAALKALATGDMEKLNFAAAPQPVPDLPITDEAGDAHHLSDYRGKIVLLNFWATWCGPCRKEMATLDRLQAGMGGTDFAVVTVATLHNTVPAVKRFFARENIAHLPIRLDPGSALARRLGIFGLPVTLILNRQGQEVARLIGEADWDSDSAKAVLKAMIAGS